MVDDGKTAERNIVVDVHEDTPHRAIFLFYLIECSGWLLSDPIYKRPSRDSSHKNENTIIIYSSSSTHEENYEDYETQWASSVVLDPTNSHCMYKNN